MPDAAGREAASRKKHGRGGKEVDVRRDRFPAERLR